MSCYPLYSFDRLFAKWSINVTSLPLPTQFFDELQRVMKAKTYLKGFIGFLKIAAVIVLLAIFSFWSLKAIQKYFSRPISSSVSYTFGDDGRGNIGMYLYDIFKISLSIRVQDSSSTKNSSPDSSSPDSSSAKQFFPRPILPWTVLPLRQFFPRDSSSPDSSSPGTVLPLRQFFPWTILPQKVHRWKMNFQGMNCLGKNCPGKNCLGKNCFRGRTVSGEELSREEFFGEELSREELVGEELYRNL